MIAAFRSELFSAATTIAFTGRNDDRDLPLGICFFIDVDDHVYGDRICNNALAGAIINILVVQTLIVVDLLIPCLHKKVHAQFVYTNSMVTCVKYKYLYIAICILCSYVLYI